MGSDFRGVYDRIDRARCSSRAASTERLRVDETRVEGEPDSDAVRAAMGPFAATSDRIRWTLLDGAGAAFDPELVARGVQTPMFFGSALTNYGVLPFLDRFLELAPPPGRAHVDARADRSGRRIRSPASCSRSRRTWIRITAIGSRSCASARATSCAARPRCTCARGKKVRLSRSTLLQAQEREIVDEAFPGDVVGLFDPGIFRIGDTVCGRGRLRLRRHSELLAGALRRASKWREVLKRKALAKGLVAARAGRCGADLHRAGRGIRGADPRRGRSAAVRSAAAPHADRVRRRRCELTPLPYQLARWPHGGFDPEAFRYSESVKIVEDRDQRPVLLFRTTWNLDMTRQKNPDLELAETGDPIERTEPDADA